MSKKQRSKRSGRSANDDISIPLNPRYIIAAVVILAVIGIAWAFIAAQKSGTASTAEACTPTTRQYATEPEMQIDVNKQYTATVTMAKGGEFTIQLFPDKAPRTVNSFVFLARDHFFDCVTFHRVLDGFMAQGGDPTGTGSGGPGYQVDLETSDLTFDKAGMVAMAHPGNDPDGNGSQFFITFGAAEHLNGGYTIFGQVTSGMEVVNSITLRDPDQAPTFQGDVIEAITITEQ